MPTAKSAASDAPSAMPRSSSASLAAAARIAGTLIRNVNRAATSRRKPERHPGGNRRAGSRDAGNQRQRLRDADAKRPGHASAALRRPCGRRCARSRRAARRRRAARPPPRAASGSRARRRPTRRNRPTITTGTVPATTSQIRRPSASGDAANARGTAAHHAEQVAPEIRSRPPRACRCGTATSNGSPRRPASQPKNARARIRWAELETGRNSVSPWTAPSTAAATRFTGRALRGAPAARLRPRRRACGGGARAPSRIRTGLSRTATADAM